MRFWRTALLIFIICFAAGFCSACEVAHTHEPRAGDPAVRDVSMTYVRDQHTGYCYAIYGQGMDRLNCDAARKYVKR